MQSSKPGCALFNKTKLGQLTTAINVVFLREKGGGRGKRKEGGGGSLCMDLLAVYGETQT